MPAVKKVRGGDARSLTKNQRPRVVKEEGVVLPTKANVPPTSFFSYVTLWYGEKGVGKSSLLGEYPDPLVFMLETRRRNLPIIQVPQQGEPPLNYDRLRRYRDKILSSDRFETIGIDTADRLYWMVYDYVCAEEQITKPSDKQGYEAAGVWSTIKKEFEDFMISLLASERTLALTSHARFREVVMTNGDTFNQCVPTMSDASWTILKGITDYAFFYGYENQERVFQLRQSDRVWASCGTNQNHFLNRNGEPLLLIKAGESPKQAYKTVLNSFNNKVEGDLYYPENEDEEQEEAEDVELPAKGGKAKRKRR